MIEAVYVTFINRESFSEVEGKVERWAFSKSDLKNPKELKSDDELIAEMSIGHEDREGF